MLHILCNQKSFCIFAAELGTIIMIIGMENPFTIKSYVSKELFCDRETVYLQYRQMLTDKQWGYLIAVAKEGSVQQITANDFLKKHQIGSPSVSRRLAEALCEKGLLNDDITLEGTIYSLSDVFLSHWMERL